MGNQPDWVIAMVACFRQGHVVLACNEQLRAKDLQLRLEVCAPALVICDGRNPAVLREAGWKGPAILTPGVATWPTRKPPPPAALDPLDPCLITFTSGTAGEPKAVVHGQRWLAGQGVQAEHWLAPRPRRAGVVHGGERLEQVGAQRLHRAVDPGRRGACCTMRASTHTSAWRSSSARPSTSSAWRPRSTALSPSAPS